MKVNQIHEIAILGEDRIASDLDLAYASGLTHARRSVLMNEIMAQILVYGRQSGILQFTIKGVWQTATTPVVDRDLVRFSVQWSLTRTITTLI